MKFKIEDAVVFNYDRSSFGSLPEIHGTIIGDRRETGDPSIYRFKPDEDIPYNIMYARFHEEDCSFLVCEKYLEFTNADDEQDKCFDEQGIENLI